MTVRDLIRLAMLDIQVLSAGENMTATEAQDALTLLNGLLASWNLESLMVYAIDTSTQALVAGQQSYTVGAGGNFNIARPDRIERIMFRETTSGIELLLVEMDERQYAVETLKTTPSTWPTYYYYKPSYPLATLFFWPVPSIGNQVVIHYWHQLTAFPNLDTIITLPPGYERMIRSNLALELAPMFAAQPSPYVLGVAAESKLLIRTTNTRIYPLQFDERLITGGHFDWRTGEYR
jgi:hypothetical protein